MKEVLSNNFEQQDGFQKLEKTINFLRSMSSDVGYLEAINISAEKFLSFIKQIDEQITSLGDNEKKIDLKSEFNSIVQETIDNCLKFLLKDQRELMTAKFFSKKSNDGEPIKIINKNFSSTFDTKDFLTSTIALIDKIDNILSLIDEVGKLNNLQINVNIKNIKANKDKIETELQEEYPNFFQK